MTINPEEFAGQQVDPLSTEFVNVPEGEFEMLLDSDNTMLVPREIKYVDKTTNAPASFFQLPLKCVVLDAQVKKKLDRDRVTCPMPVSLDLVDGSLDTGEGKNVFLGQIRDALDQNVPGWTPMHLLGAGPFIGRVSHRQDKKRPERYYAEVVAVAAIK